MLDFNQRCVGHLQAVAPLDDQSSLVGQLLQAEVGELGGVLDAVQVDVRELHAAGIDAHQLERRAGDRCDRGCAAGHAAHKGGLARSQLARQQDHVTRAQPLSKQLAERLGFGR